MARSLSATPTHASTTSFKSPGLIRLCVLEVAQKFLDPLRDGQRTTVNTTLRMEEYGGEHEFDWVLLKPAPRAGNSDDSTGEGSGVAGS